MQRMTRAAVAALVACLCLGLCLAQGGAALAADTASMMSQADQLFAQRGQAGQAQAAAELYEKILAADPKAEEAAWKAARAWYWVGSHTQGDDARAAIFEKGIADAKKAIAIDANSIGGHYWLGVSYGLYGTAKGVTKSLSLIDPIKEEMAKVIELDPEYDQGGPYRVLGRLYFKVPGLFGGDNDEAIKNLKIAVQKGPKRYLNHIYLAEVYIDEGENGKAKALLTEVIGGTPDPGFEPDMKDWKAKAQELMKEVQ